MQFDWFIISGCVVVVVSLLLASLFARLFILLICKFPLPFCHSYIFLASKVM